MKLRSKTNNRSTCLVENLMLDTQEKSNSVNAIKYLRNYKQTNLEMFSTIEQTGCTHRKMLIHEKLELSKRKMSPDEKCSLCKIKCGNIKDLTLSIDKTPRKKLLKEVAKYNRKMPIRMMTPKSSLITVALTPPRSKKIPKKSPMNLTSPKTHDSTLSRVSKTPRKLSLHAKSQMTFSNLNMFSHMSFTSQKQQIDKTSEISMLKRMEGKSSLPQMHSKLPKILLRPVQLKLKKSKSPKRKLIVNRSIDISMGKVYNRETSPIKEKALSKEMLNITGVNKTVSSLKIIAMSNNPRVMLQRLTLCGGINEYQKQPKTDSSVKLETQLRNDSKEIFKNDVSNICIAHEMSAIHGKNINVSTEEMDKTKPIRSSTPETEFESLLAGLEKSDTKSNLKLKNETYEILEPKISTMQQKRKNQGLSKTSHTNNSQVNEIQKLPKVHFTRSLTNRKSTTKVENKQEGRKTIRNKRVNDDDGNMGISKRMTVNLRSNNSRTKNAANPTTRTSPHQGLESKNLVTHKVPNFMQIHERMFARSESIVDAVKRIREKHTALTKISLRATAKHKSPLPSSPSLSSMSMLSRNVYNRFAYKLRKTQASDIILRKLQPYSRNRQQERQHESRTILKGVRTNRRFELQMKHRNIKF